MDILVYPHAKWGAALDWGAGEKRAAIGRGGFGVKTGEGDGVTPSGVWPVRRLFYRADRAGALETSLPQSAIGQRDGWCDAPDDPSYNRQVMLPYPASAEHLWRDDHLYDRIAVLGFNDAPVVPGAGSAIFLHVARPDYGPTEGCVALAPDDLVEALAQLERGDKVRIGPAR